MAVPTIDCSLTSEQTNLVRLMQAKAHDLSDSGQVPDIEQGVAYRDLEASVQDVILRAPGPAISSLGKTVNPALSAEDTGQVLALPSDYLRFVSVRLDNWYRWVFELTDSDSPAHVFQSLPYTNATPYRPLAVYRPGVGTGELKLYPSGTTATLKYAPRVAPELLPTLLMEPLLWMALSKYMQPDEPVLADRAEKQFMLALDALNQQSGQTNAVPTTQ